MTRRLVVVRYGDVSQRVIGTMATPRLLDACNDGRGHEAWEQNGVWRLREDEYDAIHKPADVPYKVVQAGWADF